MCSKCQWDNNDDDMCCLDGIITDFEETKKAIISASDLPMSIIIVGKLNFFLCVLVRHQICTFKKKGKHILYKYISKQGRGSESAFNFPPGSGGKHWRRKKLKKCIEIGYNCSFIKIKQLISLEMGIEPEFQCCWGGGSITANLQFCKAGSGSALRKRAGSGSAKMNADPQPCFQQRSFIFLVCRCGPWRFPRHGWAGQRRESAQMWQPGKLFESLLPVFYVMWSRSILILTRLQL